MDALTDISIERFIGAAIAVALWAWLLFFCVARTRRVAAEHEEPILWLYSGGFKATRILLFFPFAIVGYLLPMTANPAEYFGDLALPWTLGLVQVVIVGGLALLVVRLYLQKKSEEEAVVIEATSTASQMLQLFGGLAVLSLIGALPFIGAYYFEIDPEDLILMSDFGGAIAMSATLIAFWIIPYSLGERLLQLEADDVWVRSPGLVFFRWAWLGILVLIIGGVPAGIPGLDLVFAVPLQIYLGILLPLLAVGFFALWWVWPMRSMVAATEDESNFLARDRAPSVRALGFPAYLAYLRARGKQRKEVSEDSKLCPTCLRPIDDIEAYKNLKFDACPHCGSYIPPVYSVNDYLEHQERTLVPIIQSDGAKRGKKKKGEPETQRVQELLKALLAAALAQRGTDVHMVNENDRFIVRSRIDGVLYPMMEFDEVMARPMINALKVMANMDITERRKPQDGSFKTELLGRRVDVRVNTSPVADSEMAAARLLYRSSVLGSIEALGMSSRHAKMLTGLIARHQGLILVTGPTGSGKSTTLYNALEQLSSGDRNIITLEDPVEYQLKGATQMQISAKKGFTFATGLRSILRQDPDVIMVGEIRDSDTAKMAIDAAATGHLVFSTLHSMDSVSAIQRLTDLDIDEARLATVVLLILAQRLIRLNCPQCGEERALRREDLESIGIPGAPEEEFIVKVGTGCVYCRETGYFGREGLYEFFMPNEVTRDLISRGATISSIRTTARESGMRTMFEDGLTKVLLGRTTLEEVLRVVS